MKQRIVLRPHVGGLGDSLLYSTLPERWVRETGAEVYIKDPIFRNDGIPQLLWRSNPFVSGIVTEPATHALYDEERLRRFCLKYGSNVMGMEAFFGFEPLNEFPRLYWVPAYIRELRDIVLVDPVAVTVPFTREAFEPFVHYLHGRGLASVENMRVLSVGGSDSQTSFLPGLPRLAVKDIFDCASAIYSCGAFVSNHSGLTALASALKGSHPFPRVHAIIAQAIFNNRVWVWSNIDYRVTGRLLQDFQVV